MFKSARIKLTIWYVIILGVITLIFSFAVYKSVMMDVERASIMHQRRIERRLNDNQSYIMPPPGFKGMRPGFVEMENLTNIEELLSEVRNSTIRMLTIVNIVILLFAGSLSYLLAGVTLKPIEEMLNKQKKFIADAAHELKTPLTSMKTSLEVTLMDKDLNLKQAKETIENSIEDVDSLTSFVQLMLKQNRYESHASKDSYEKFNVKSLIDKILSKFDPNIKSKNLKIISNIENIEIFDDKYAIKELLTILIDNAIKFSNSDGVIEIDINKHNNNFNFKIKDYGIGIHKKELPNIFDRFYKSDQSRSKSMNGNGFGLGLSIAKEIVSSHKGTISVESEIGKYTIVKVKLPQ